jgi:hypothetical protein
MSFVNQPLTQNVAGGLGGQADAQLAREALRNQVQPSKDIMVARTSGGTFLTLREPRGGSSTTTGTTTGTTVVEYRSDINAATVAANMLGITTAHGQQLFYGEANLEGSQYASPTVVNWIGPPIISGVASAQSVYSYTKQPNGFFQPEGAMLDGSGATRWKIWSYEYGEQILLGKLPRPLAVSNADGSVFRADWVDLNNAGRIWTWVT